MLVRMRYSVEKRNADGSSRWYWQRPGFPTKRLPEDESERFQAVTALNERADSEKRGETLPHGVTFGTIAWAIKTYRESPKYTRKAAGTRRVYERWMLALERTVGAEPVTALTRRRVKEILTGIESAGGKVHCAAVLKKIADVAWDHELITSNPAIRLELEKSRRRDQVWTEDDIAAFLTACEGERFGEAVALAFTILLHTAQRPGDVRRMTWGQYDGQTLRLRQQKTGTPLAVPCTEELRAALDAAKAKASGVNIVAKPNGQPIPDSTWDKVFNPIRTKAGLDHLQARDLRRTAIVRLAMAGCSAPEIASVSGHSLESTERILEVYLPRTASMAQSAITKLEEYRK